MNNDMDLPTGYPVKLVIILKNLKFTKVCKSEKAYLKWLSCAPEKFNIKSKMKPFVIGWKSI